VKQAPERQQHGHHHGEKLGHGSGAAIARMAQ
jgi:hypothetical protein